MLDELGPRHGIIDELKRIRLSRGRQRPDRRQRHFLAKTSLAIPKDLRLGLSRDVVSVRECLRRLRNGDRAERRAGHHFSAVHPLETQQFDAPAKRAEHRVATRRPSCDNHRLGGRRRRRFLRFRQSRAQYENPTEHCTDTYSAIHYSFSSSLPNCCEIFAIAIAASPSFNSAIHAPASPTCSFASPLPAGFHLSQKDAAPIRVFLPEASRERPAPLQHLLWQPHRFRQPIIAA